MQEDIKSKTQEELTEALKDWSLPAFRSKQIFRWLQQGVCSFEEMTNLPKDLRAKLAERFYIATAEVARKQVSRLDGTVKYLFRLHDGQHVECVLMEYHHGMSVCISTQVGCRMGCSFCATGKSGYSPLRKCFLKSRQPSTIPAGVSQTLFSWEWGNRLTTMKT